MIISGYDCTNEVIRMNVTLIVVVVVVVVKAWKRVLRRFCVRA